MEFELSRDKKGMPVIKSVPRFDLSGNKVTHCFTREGRRKRSQESLTVLLKTPSQWNNAVDTSHTTAILGQKRGEKMAQQQLSLIVRQYNAQRAKAKDDALFEKTSEKLLDANIVETCFKDRLFPHGTGSLPAQVSFRSFLPRSVAQPPSVHIRLHFVEYLQRCAGLYGVACQCIGPADDTKSISLLRSTFCRFILDCKLVNADTMPYSTVVEMGFDKWKRVSSGGEAGGIGLEVLDLPQFCQSVFSIAKVFFQRHDIEYFFDQHGKAKIPGVPLLRYAEESTPDCAWVSEKFGNRCNAIRGTPIAHMPWQRRMVRNMLIEPGAIHLITAYRWVFSALFESYAVDGHVSEPHFMRFCADFQLIPEWGAKQLFVAAYRNAECVDCLLVPPEKKLIQKLALQPFHDLFESDLEWKHAWQNVAGKRTQIDAPAWKLALGAVFPRYGAQATALAWDALTWAPREGGAPWLLGIRKTTPAATSLNINAFVATMSELWPRGAVGAAPFPSEGRRLGRRGSTGGLMVPDALEGPMASTSDAVDFVLQLVGRHYDLRAGWGKLIRSGLSEGEADPLSGQTSARKLQRRHSTRAPLAIFADAARKQMRKNQQPRSVEGVLTSDEFLRATVPKYVPRMDPAKALFRTLLTMGKVDEPPSPVARGQPPMRMRRHSLTSLKAKPKPKMAEPTEAYDPRLRISHLLCVAQEITRRNYANELHDHSGQSRKFGLAAFVEALCAGALAQWSFFSTEVRQSTSTVNKLAALMSHFKHWADCPDDRWEPDECTPKTQNQGCWDDHFFPEDTSVRAWRKEVRTKQWWADRKRAMWALQRLAPLDLQDPPSICSLLNTSGVCSACSVAATPEGWGNPHCARCSCASRALALQLYPCRQLMCTPCAEDVPQVKLEQRAVPEPTASPFTTLTAFRPNQGRMQASNASGPPNPGRKAVDLRMQASALF